MTNCSQTRKLIDEADRPGVFSYETARHIASCPPCKDFAEERARLRHLIASSAKVSAPSNFDAMLGARLAAVRTRPAFARNIGRTYALPLLSSPSGLLRYAAATAAVVIGVFVASYSGLFSNPAPAEKVDNRGVAAPTSTPVAPGSAEHRVEQLTATPGTMVSKAVYIPASNHNKRRRAPNRPVSIQPDLATAGTQTLLVRGEDYEHEVPMPTVSVGAQPLLYVGTGRSAGVGPRASF